MIMLSILRTNDGYLTRLGLGVVKVATADDLQKKLGFIPHSEKNYFTRYAEINKASEKKFILSFTDISNGAQAVNLTFKTFAAAVAWLGRVYFVLPE